MKNEVLSGCGAKGKGSSLEEIDGKEFDVDSLEDFMGILKSYKKVHLNYISIEGEEMDLDLWIEAR